MLRWVFVQFRRFVPGTASSPCRSCGLCASSLARYRPCSMWPPGCRAASRPGGVDPRMRSADRRLGQKCQARVGEVGAAGAVSDLETGPGDPQRAASGRPPGLGGRSEGRRMCALPGVHRGEALACRADHRDQQWTRPPVLSGRRRPRRLMAPSSRLWPRRPWSCRCSRGSSPGVGMRWRPDRSRSWRLRPSQRRGTVCVRSGAQGPWRCSSMIR
ncbi:Uncharacterised protein [Mycobacteroides abscessus subsp. abscessus]|nr:Uncharacterised protein [Mycobacteroides abscessus subsp. abscessus]SLF24875.1 Uncharacterised protein [Mycobacteroides abscessus subsp. abscessus]